MKEPPPPRRRGAHGSKSGHFFLTHAKTNGSKLAYANRHSPIPLPTCARFPAEALPKESSHVLFMTDSPPGENSLPLSLPLEEMEEERERKRTRDGFRSEKFFRGRGGGFSRRNFVGACRRR